MLLRRTPVLLELLAISFLQVTAHEVFTEDLSLKSLPDGKLLAHFAFSSHLHGATPRAPETLLTDDEPQHYMLFPLSLGQILREYAVPELHLSLNSGKWDYDRWGYPSESEVATGAQLWAWMADGAPNLTVEQRWQGLRNSLAGLFCASLGSLNDQRTTSPVRSFLPSGQLPKVSESSHYELRHATLPSESVCTENLTPFLKLLPCKSLSGIAQLLNPHRLFDADWHGMSVHVLWSEMEGVEVKLSFQAVLDPVRLSSANKRNWSFREIFNADIDRTCAVASRSTVTVANPASTEYQLTPHPSSMSDDAVHFDVLSVDLPLDIAYRWPNENPFQYPLYPPETPLVPLSIQRTLHGSDQTRGQLSVVLKNSLDQEAEVVYLEAMPWLLEFYLHTLQINVDGQRRDDLISDIRYEPTIGSRPTLFESVLRVPPRSTLRLSFDVTKTFLKYTDHPPDAQRGWDLPPAVFVLSSSSSPSTSPSSSSSSTSPSNHTTVPVAYQRIYTPVLLVDLATPDFSMPYNVNIMTSTLIALLFGSVLNMLMRSFKVVRVPVE